MADAPTLNQLREQIDSLDGQIGYFTGRLRSMPTPEMGQLIAGNIRERLDKMRALLATTPSPPVEVPSPQPPAAPLTTWKPLTYATPMDLWKAFKGGAKFVLHYHGKAYPVERMEARAVVVYVQPPNMAVKLYPDGRNCESAGDAIWLEELTTHKDAP